MKLINKSINIPINISIQDKKPVEDYGMIKEHNIKSKEIYDFISELDFKNGDVFCFKSGGDGDNGELLMDLLDCYFESKRLSEV